MMKKLLLNFIASVFCFFLAVVMTLAAEYTDATDNLTVEWLGGDGTDIYNLTGDNVVAIRSERGHATVNITGTGSRVVDNCSDDGCPTQYFNGQFTTAFNATDGTKIGTQHFPPWYGVHMPASADNCVINGGVVACTPVLGSELSPNGTFTDWTGSDPNAYPTGWTLGGSSATSYITNDSNRLRMVSDGSTILTLIATNALTIGKWYTHAANVISITSGTIVRYDDGTGNRAWGVGKQRTISKTAAASPYFARSAAGSASEWIVDDHTIKEVIWSTFLSNLTDYKFKTEVVYSIDMTVADGDIAGIAFKVGDTTAGSEDFCLAYLNKGTGKVELMKVVGGAVTTPLSAAVTYSAGATLKLISADGIKWIVVYNGSQVGTEQTLSEASLDSSVAGFFATSASTTFDNWKAGRWQLGSELVTNGDGESLTGWTTTGGDLSEVVSGGAIGNCFKIAETNAGIGYLLRVLTFEAGKYYAFSIRVKRGSSGLFWSFYHKDTTVGTTFLNPSGLALVTSTDATPASWAKYVRVAGFPAGTADVVGEIVFGDSGGSGATEYTYFDEVSIREIQ